MASALFRPVPALFKNSGREKALSSVDPSAQSSSLSSPLLLIHLLRPSTGISLYLYIFFDTFCAFAHFHLSTHTCHFPQSSSHSIRPAVRLDCRGSKLMN
jgi:hypothetical protein